MPDDLLRWTLPTKELGQRVHLYDCLDSTNSLALSLADDPEHHGIVVLAREQTAGRGQYGRSWHAPPNSSVLLSVLLFPPVSLRRPPLLTAWAAVSVCETILAITKLHATIKWPNDVLIAGKKICGILIEQRTTGHADFPLATVAGIGLNVTQSAAMFEGAGLPSATSLASASGAAFSFEEVAMELIHQLDRQYGLMVDGAVNTLETSWKGRLGLVGKDVIVEGVNQQYRGRLCDAAFAGLDLEVGPGDVVRLLPESVRQLRSVDGFTS
jgi:BirA family biotin operon repressor/biotin-[acetyl-CoA-carboxylase] ligase